MSANSTTHCIILSKYRDFQDSLALQVDNFSRLIAAHITVLSISVSQSDTKADYSLSFLLSKTTLGNSRHHPKSHRV